MNHKKKKGNIPSWYNKLIGLRKNTVCTDKRNSESEETTDIAARRANDFEWDYFENRFNVFLG